MSNSAEGDITTAPSAGLVGRRLTFFDNHSATHSLERESLLSSAPMALGDQVSQRTLDANNRHTLKGKPRKIWVRAPLPRKAQDHDIN